MPAAIAAAQQPTDQWSLAVLAAGALIGAAIVAGIFTLIVALIGRANAKLQAALARATAEQTNTISRENAKLQTRLAANLKLAEMRQAWINSLRDDMAAFQSLGVTPGVNHAQQTEFYRLGTRIELFMNPGDPDYPELHDALYKFLSASEIHEKYAANPGFVDVCQRILKREWDVLKSEIRSVTD